MSEKSKVAFAFISKDKASSIIRLLNSTKDVFDGYFYNDTGSTDSSVADFEKWCKDHHKEYGVMETQVGKDYRSVIVDGKEVLANFAQARQDCLSLIPRDYKYYKWADSDDVLIGAEYIPTLVELCDKNNVDQVIEPYDYATMPDGRKAVAQQRERLINLQKKGVWGHIISNLSVHENYQFQEGARIALMSDFKLPISTKHERTALESLATNRRNHLIMELQIKEVGIENYPEDMLNNYAFDMWEHREFVDAIKYYKILLKRFKDKQVNPEMLFQIHIRVAKAYFELKDLGNASKYAFLSIKDQPNIADGYLLLGELFIELQNFEEAERYADKVIQMGMPNTTAPINEYDYLVIPRRIKLVSYVARNMLDKALEMSKELNQILQGNPQVKSEYFNIYNDIRRQHAIQAIGELSLYFQEHNKYGDVDRILDVIPLELKDDDNVRKVIKGLMIDKERKVNRIEFDKNYQKSIVIFAGQGYEQWDGESDIKKGIGGSEGMCIQLSRELAKLGNKVFVYNDCGESNGKTFDGVQYLDWHTWNGGIKSDIFISLRRPDIFSQIIKAKKQYLWLHDTEYGDVPLINLYVPNKVIVLSDYHKNIIKLNHGVSDDNQFWVSRNGLNSKAVEYADKNAKERKPYQLIYASSYDRGLNNLLAMWPKIKEAVPEATLKIFYGWNTMDKMIQMRAQMGDTQFANQMMQFKSGIIDQISKLPGVFELGRVSQEELYKNFEESSIWIYPTQFTEISCITGMCAEAMGAVPVCTPVAALNETVDGKFGIKTDLDKIADAAIYLLKNQDELERRRAEMIPWAREAFNMRQLAREWDSYFDKQ